jgi:hypothetical protein
VSGAVKMEMEQNKNSLFVCFSENYFMIAHCYH